MLEKELAQAAKMAEQANKKVAALQKDKQAKDQADDARNQA